MPSVARSMSFFSLVLPNASRERFAALCAFCVPIALLLYLLPTGLTWVAIDSGDLATAICTTGVAHPSGYPLYVLIGKLAVWLLPSLEPCVAIALFSIVCTAFASLSLFWWSMLLGGGPIAALFGSLLYCTCSEVMLQGKIVDVYAFHAAFTCLIMWQCTRAILRRSRVSLWIATLAFGCSLTNHLTAGLLGFFLVWAWYNFVRQSSPASWGRSVALAFLSLVLCQLPYCYIPWASQHAAKTIVWNQPTSFSNLVLKQILGSEFHAFFSVEPSAVVRRASYFFAYASAQFHVYGIVLAAVGACALWSAGLLWQVVVFGGLPFFLYISSYGIDDIQGYYLPLLALIALSGGLGLHWLLERLHFLRRGRALQGMLLVLLFGSAIGSCWRMRDLRNAGTLAENYANNVLDNTPRGAILLVEHYWHVPALWYYAYAIAADPQKAIIGTTFYREKSWYRDFVHTYYPWVAFPKLPNMEERSLAEISKAFVTLNAERRRIFFNARELPHLPGRAYISNRYLLESRSEREKTRTVEPSALIYQVYLGLRDGHHVVARNNTYAYSAPPVCFVDWRRRRFHLTEWRWRDPSGSLAHVAVEETSPEILRSVSFLPVRKVGTPQQRGLWSVEVLVDGSLQSRLQFWMSAS